MQSQPITDGQQLHLCAFVQQSDLRQQIRAIVEELGLSQSAVEKGSIKTAIDFFGTHRSPRILIVDISASELPLSDAEALAEVCEPSTQVIMIGDRNDVGLFRALMATGVLDYLVQPITETLLKRALLSVLDPQFAKAQSSRLGKLVAVLGARGGTGTTTIAAGLAHQVSTIFKRRVVLVDPDASFGNSAMILDAKGPYGLKELLQEHARLDKFMIERSVAPLSSTFHLLADDVSELRPRTDEAGGLAVLLEHLRSMYHYVLVDVPHGALTILRETVGSANVAVIVADESLASTRDTVRLYHHIRDIQPACDVRVVLNKLDKRSARAFAASMNELIDNRVLGQVSDLGEVRSALQISELLTPSSGGFSAAVASLAEEFVRGAANRTGGKAKSGLWRKLDVWKATRR